MLTKAQGDEMETWFPDSDDLKDYAAPVRFMDNAMKVAGAVAALACIGILTVVALGWPS